LCCSRYHARVKIHLVERMLTSHSYLVQHVSEHIRSDLSLLFAVLYVSPIYVHGPHLNDTPELCRHPRL
jgi:hypothetical protein